MPRFLELKAQLATLNIKIEVARADEKAAAIREIQAKMYEWGIQLRDLQIARNGRRYVPTKSGRYVPKYRDPDSGATWSGKGREPRWIAGKNRAAFSFEIDELIAQNVELPAFSTLDRITEQIHAKTPDAVVQACCPAPYRRAEARP